MSPRAFRREPHEKRGGRSPDTKQGGQDTDEPAPGVRETRFRYRQRDHHRREAASAGEALITEARTVARSVSAFPERALVHAQAEGRAVSQADGCVGLSAVGNAPREEWPRDWPWPSLGLPWCSCRSRRA